MRHFIPLFLFLFVAGSIALPETAQSYNLKYINHKFDHKILKRGEIHRIQSALSLLGKFDGRVTGYWDKKTENSLTAYTIDKYKSKTPKWKHVVDLTNKFNRLVSLLKITRIKSDKYAFIIVYPAKMMNNYKNKKYNYKGFKTAKPGLNIKFYSTGLKKPRELTLKFHNLFRIKTKQPLDIINVQEDAANEFITEINKPNGSLFIHSKKHSSGNWQTVHLEGLTSHKYYYQFIRNNLTTDMTVPKRMPAKGFLADLTVLSKISKFKNIGSNAQLVRANNKPLEKKKKYNSSGTGFHINKKGHILTNYHVIQGCKKVIANGRKLNLIASSGTDDLAVMQYKKPYLVKNFARFTGVVPKLNSDVTVGGYPYSAILGGFNVTRGVISGRAGYKGNKRNWQISAALQSGNSGGAVLDKYGNVVGIVVGKLNPIRTARRKVEIPQNVNFAVKASAAKQFLGENQIPYHIGNLKSRPSPETLGAKLDKFSVLIKCEREKTVRGDTKVKYYGNDPGNLPFFKPRKKYIYKNQPSLEDEAFGK